MKRGATFYAIKCVIIIFIFIISCLSYAGNYEYADDVKRAEKKKNQEEGNVVWKQLRERIGDIYEASTGANEKKIHFYDKNNPTSRIFVIKKPEIFTILDGHVKSGCSHWLSTSIARPQKCNFSSTGLLVVYEVEFVSGKIAYFPVEYPSNMETGRELVIDNISFIRRPTEEETKKIISASKKRRGK